MVEVRNMMEVRSNEQGTGPCDPARRNQYIFLSVALTHSYFKQPPDQEPAQQADLQIPGIHEGYLQLV